MGTESNSPVSARSSSPPPFPEACIANVPNASWLIAMCANERLASHSSPSKASAEIVFSGSAMPNGTPSQTTQVGAYSTQRPSRVPKSEVSSAKRRKHDIEASRIAPSGEPLSSHKLVRTVQLFVSSGGGDV